MSYMCQVNGWTKQDHITYPNHGNAKECYKLQTPRLNYTRQVAILLLIRDKETGVMPIYDARYLRGALSASEL